MSKRVSSEIIKESKPELFSAFPQLLEKFISNQLDINKIQEATREYVSIISDSSTWVSSTRRDGDKMHIRVGEQKLPESVAIRVCLGADTTEQEYVVKVAHEYAHVVQNMFDRDLLAWLDGADNIPEESIPYIQLYSALAMIGGLHGLSQMNIYHEQNKTTGNLSMPVYEDIAETIGSYMLGTEYFNYRVQNASRKITQEQRLELLKYVEAVITTFLKSK
jgi:hypothetical protein